eukprot:1161925-Pelagomonas_calceolata.AAC.7
MASLVLPLETVPAALHSPYRTSLLAKQEPAAAAAAAAGGSSAASCADAPSDDVTSQGKTHIKGAEAQPAPEGEVPSQKGGVVLKPVDRELGQQVVDAVRDAQVVGAVRDVQMSHSSLVVAGVDYMGLI